jgi:hypothetical protein
LWTCTLYPSFSSLSWGKLMHHFFPYSLLLFFCSFVCFGLFWWFQSTPINMLSPGEKEQIKANKLYPSMKQVRQFISLIICLCISHTRILYKETDSYNMALIIGFLTFYFYKVTCTF